MPNYLTEPAIIDWHYDDTDPALHLFIQGANADLTSPYHGLVSFEEQLRVVAKAHATLVIDALADGVLFRARRGVVEELQVKTSSDPAITELVARLAAYDFVSVPEPPLTADRTVEQALYWPGDMLDELVRETTRRGDSLSRIVHEAWKRTRPTIATSTRDELERLVSRYGGEQRQQSLLFPGDILAELLHEAERLECPLSFVAHCAWAVSLEGN